jgi:aminoglycoside phosphotransferase (APT) family kinase protein
VPFASEDERAFGVPYVVMDRMPGRVYFVWDPHESFVRTPEAAAPLWRQCAEALPRFHRFDWRTRLAGWQEPEPLLDQVKRWQKVYRHSPEPDWIARAERVEELLLASLPDGEPVGIVDWELSGIGAQLLDVGWLMMAADPESFVDAWHPIHPIPCDEIRAIYEQGMGRRFEAIAWFQAFAGYRLASIGCLNVKLHRTGRRVDPTWERIALGVAQMFERAREILSR